MADQARAVYADASGSPAVKCTTAAMTPAPAGIGMPTKYFFPGRPGIRRLRIAADVEARQAAGSRDQKEKAGNRSQLRQLDVPLSWLSNTGGIR